MSLIPMRSQYISVKRCGVSILVFFFFDAVVEALDKDIPPKLRHIILLLFFWVILSSVCVKTSELIDSPRFMS